MAEITIKAVPYSVSGKPERKISERTDNPYLSFSLTNDADTLEEPTSYPMFFRGTEDEIDAKIDAMIDLYEKGKIKRIYLARLEVHVRDLTDQLPEARPYIRFWETTDKFHEEGDIVGVRGKNDQILPRVFHTVPVTIRCTDPTTPARGEDPVKMASRWLRSNEINGSVMYADEYKPDEDGYSEVQRQLRLAGYDAADVEDPFEGGYSNEPDPDYEPEVKDSTPPTNPNNNNRDRRNRR